MDTRRTLETAQILFSQPVIGRRTGSSLLVSGILVLAATDFSHRRSQPETAADAQGQHRIPTYNSSLLSSLRASILLLPLP